MCSPRALGNYPVLLVQCGAGVHRVRRVRGAARGDHELPHRQPLVNEVAIALLLGLFGVGPTLLYVAAGLTIAIVAGFVIGRLKLERYVEPFVYETTLRGKPLDPSVGLTWDDRFQMGREEVATILRKIWPYLLVGIGLGAVIHGWVPADFFATYAGADNPFGVLVAVLIGVPLYSNARHPPSGRRPYAKGLPWGPCWPS